MTVSAARPRVARATFWRRLVAAAACVAWLSACDSPDDASPVAPSAATPALQRGEYDVSLSGIACTGSAPGPFPTSPAPSVSTLARVLVTVSRDGGVWVVRASTAADGDVAMRLSEVYAYPTLIAVTGSISGTAIDQRGFAGSGPLTMAITAADGGHAATTGGLNTTERGFAFESLGVGSSTGRFVQSSRAGSVTCAQFVWSIARRSA